MSKHSAKVAGVQFEGSQSIIPFCQEGDPVKLEREPDNRYDGNALKVVHDRGQIGYVPKALAAHLAPHFDSGEVATAKIIAINGGSRRYPTLGVEIAIEMHPNPKPFDDDPFEALIP